MNEFPLLATLVALLPPLASGLLGLLAGSLLTEGALLVPYWRMLSAAEFGRLHPVFGPRLYRYFAPLTMAAPLAALGSLVVLVATGAATLWFGALAVALVLGAVTTYFVFFEKTNARFSRHDYTEDELPELLKRWAAWHRFRTVLAVGAFAASLGVR